MAMSDSDRYAPTRIMSLPARSAIRATSWFVPSNAGPTKARMQVCATIPSTINFNRLPASRAAPSDENNRCSPLSGLIGSTAA